MTPASPTTDDRRAATRGNWLRQRFAAFARPRGAEPLPVRLDRHRIYVLPTGFGLFFAALLTTMGVGALNYNNNPALLLALLLAGTALASLVAAQLQLSGLQVVAIDAEPVAAGTPLRLRVHARDARERERRGLRLQLGGSHAVLDLREGAGEADLAVPTRRRGWLQLERLRISTLRPLGLAIAWGYAWPNAPLLVYPAPEPSAPPLPGGRGEQSLTRLHPAGEDMHHLRNYRRGDARRAIAWKPSARRDALLVREYEQPLDAEVELDWHALPALPYETRVSRLTAWVERCEHEHRRYRLRLPGQPVLGPDAGAAHRHACLRALALLPYAAR
jgi:uncharacterized protein (DUF58 family)